MVSKEVKERSVTLNPQPEGSQETSGSSGVGLIRNALYNSGSYLIAVVTSVAVTPAMVVLLGLDGYGAFILVTGLIGYYSLLDFGLAQGVTRYVAECRGKGDLGRAAGPLLAALVFNLSVGLCAAIPVFFGAPTVVTWMQCPASMIKEATLAVQIGAFGFVGSMISGTFTAALVGLERYDLTAKIESSSIVLQNIVIVVLLSNGGGLVAAVAAAVTITACSLFLYGFLCIRHLPVALRRPSFDWGTLISLGSYSAYLFVAKISNVLSIHGVRFYIAWQFGPAAVTLYSVPTKLLGAIGGLLSTGSSVLFPFASGLGEADAGRLERIVSESSKAFAMVSIPGYLLFSGCAYPILALWMGRPFAEDSWIILSILALSSLVASQSTVLNQIVSGRGYSKLLGLFGFTALVCFAVFIPLFSFLWGLTGVAVGMLASSAVSVTVVLVKALPALQFPFVRYLASTYWPYKYLLGAGILTAVPAGLATRGVSLYWGLAFPALIILLLRGMWTADPELRKRIHRFVPGRHGT